jgi:hypothetical protein
MQKLYLTHDSNTMTWRWINDRHGTMSPSFSNRADADTWYQQIARCFGKTTVTKTKMPKLFQAA